MRQFKSRALVGFWCSGVMTVATAFAAVVPGQVIVKIGDAVSGSTVSTLNSPFTDGNGAVSFVAGLADTNRVVWKGTGPIFNSSSALPDVLTGGEGTMGSGNAGQFIYSPSFNGQDAVYCQNGKLVADDDAAPGLPGLFVSFASRPQMGPAGTAYWISGTSTTPAGSTSARVMYKATDPANPGSITPVVKGGDLVSGIPITAQGIEFPYRVSDNDTYRINRYTLATGSSTNDAVVALNDSIVAQEGSPTGDGDNHQNFRDIWVNDSGNWTLIGDTNAAADDFMMISGAIKFRQGQVVDGITLGSTVDMASINNLNQFVFLWDTGTSTESLFCGNVGNVAETQVILSTGDLIDTNGDTIGDWVISDFNASAVIGPGLDLAENGKMYLEVDLMPAAGGTAVEAIIEVAIPEPATLTLLAATALLGMRRRR